MLCREKCTGPETVAHLWSSIVFKWLKGFWPEQVGDRCSSQHFERLALPRCHSNTAQVVHEENLMLLAFCAATTQRIQKVLTFIGIYYFSAFHNPVYFSALHSTSLKSVGGGGTWHFAPLNPGTFWYQTLFRMYFEATHGWMFTIDMSIIVEVTW